MICERRDVGSGLFTVAVGDPHRLQQVLLNLIDNAIKFTNEAQVNVHVALSVSNRACGIDRNQRILSS